MKTRGADRLMETLAQAGVRRIFTVSGNHVMSVFDAVTDSGIELVHARHEAAAVHMADAASRISGEIGVALVTGGPGHANAVSALYTARMCESPVLLLSGHAANRELGMGAFQEMRQADIAAPLAKASSTCSSADAVAGDIALAIRAAQSGRPGPVHLSLPFDALEGDAGASSIPPASNLAPDPLALDSRTADALLQRLRRASRPLIIVGPAALTRRGRALAATLEDATNVPVVGMESPRGIADPSLGAFAEVLQQADCVLLIGKRLDFTLQFGRPPALSQQCVFLQIDADQSELERARRAVGDRVAVSAMADAFSALATLTQSAAANGSARSSWRDDVRDAIRYRPPSWGEARATARERLHPVEALRPLQALLDSHPDSALVADGGEFGQWAQACVSAPHRVINGVAGAIGTALPYAIGVRSVLPDAPVVAVLGDGTFGFHPAEIDTAVRYKLPFVALIGNDARWNAEYQIQLRDYGADRAHGCELLPTRYDLVAAAFGGHGELVTDASELPAAVERSQRSGLPACVNVMIEGVAAPKIRR
ncbi:MAG TPA: thiamine pyrophosphate-binding protein [Casimicrobiaceae bacterium]|nr:thiamine pyrophosphate-binding protein [Casimicrobiaceae bacterium]